MAALGLQGFAVHRHMKVSLATIRKLVSDRTDFLEKIKGVAVLASFLIC
jgi:hypothetical protein|tara:strand:+ start:767 stop:913 length:147 start_codon:yes stop_codon:yes gene_type:complete